MTPEQHAAQRERVTGSLAADDGRESHRTVYPRRSGERVPGAALAAAVAFVAQARGSEGTLTPADWHRYIAVAPNFAAAQVRMEEAVTAGVDFAALNTLSAEMEGRAA